VLDYKCNMFKYRYIDIYIYIYTIYRQQYISWINECLYDCMGWEIYIIFFGILNFATLFDNLNVKYTCLSYVQ